LMRRNSSHPRSAGPIMGFYDGIFGPGVGSFFIVGFVLLCGMGMMRAMSFTKLANASCNLGSLAVFITKGVIIWPIAIAIAIAMALAAFFGAQPRFLRSFTARCLGSYSSPFQ
jgi:hypothetical protein